MNWFMHVLGVVESRTKKKGKKKSDDQRIDLLGGFPFVLFSIHQALDSGTVSWQRRRLLSRLPLKKCIGYFIILYYIHAAVKSRKREREREKG